MFRIKICGITNVDDAVAAARAGADAIGLNFYPSSPRFVSIGQAKMISSATPTNVLKVGLFVNASAKDIHSAMGQVGFNLIQLHGDEPPEFLAELTGLPVMRAFRLGLEDLAPVGRYLDRCGQLNATPRLVLLDASVRGQYGGTGQTADWGMAKHYHEMVGGPPLVLAGGLTAENVADAIQAVRPLAVDTSSGVETSPSKKDASLIERFVSEARAAFDPL